MPNDNDPVFSENIPDRFFTSNRIIQHMHTRLMTFNFLVVDGLIHYVMLFPERIVINIQHLVPFSAFGNSALPWSDLCGIKERESTVPILSLSFYLFITKYQFNLEIHVGC